MSNYSDINFLRDFIKRTDANLAIVDKELKNGSSPAYEVTQRINSFLGFIILPFEKYGGNPSFYRNCRDNYLINKSINIIKGIIKRCKKEKRFFNNYDDIKDNEDEFDLFDIRGIIRHLKNSLSHSGNQGVSFYPISNEPGNNIKDVNIEQIVFCDINRYNNEIVSTFCISIKVKDELDLLRRAIVDIYTKMEEILVEDYRREYSSIISKSTKRKMMLLELMQTGDFETFKQKESK